MPRKRERQIKFFVSDSEYESLKIKVAESKLSQSDFLRKSALGKKIYVIDGIRDLAMQIRKVGTNLNQITKLAHQSNVSNVSAEMEQIHEELSEIWQLLKRFLRSKQRT